MSCCRHYVMIKRSYYKEGNILATMLEMRNITKRFPGVLANDNVTLKVEKGEIHALLGENGAGKTTLMNILYGLYRPQSGEIIFQGQHVMINSVQEAISLGIGMVHQHFMLIPNFTVTENIILGLESSRNIVIDSKEAEKRILALSKKYGFNVDPSAYIWQLPVGLQQRVEILKALYRGAGLLILDEPTSVLTPQETRELFIILREMAEQGTSIIFISHKLDEVMAISDRITVLRDGCVTGTVATKDTNQHELARMMVGRDVIFKVSRPSMERGELALEVENLHALNDKGLEALKGISFKLYYGEILGIAGVSGNGQEELAEVLTGLREAADGRILIDKKNLINKLPDTYIRAGVAFIPQDRKRFGSISDFSLEENLILRSESDSPFAHHGILDREAIREYSSRVIEEYDIRTPGSDIKAKSLSGGNLQKLILGREVTRPHHLLIAAQPTRGLDVGAIEFVYSRLIEERGKGSAILLISTELNEILNLSDRIAVIYEGRVVGQMEHDEASIEELGLLMTGAT